MSDDRDQATDLSALFEEGSLWEIYRRGPSLFRDTFNRSVVIIILMALTTFSSWHLWKITRGIAPLIHFREIFMKWAEVGIALTSTILGFLLAGFAVLFTLFKPETILRLQQITRAGQQLTELKLLLFVFVNVFVHYVAFLFWCVVVIVCGAKNGPFDGVLSTVAHCWSLIPQVLCHIIFVIWGAWFLVLVLKLKSFIYNLYQSLLLVIADAV